MDEALGELLDQKITLDPGETPRGSISLAQSHMSGRRQADIRILLQVLALNTQLIRSPQIIVIQECQPLRSCHSCPVVPRFSDSPVLLFYNSQIRLRAQPFSCAVGTAVIYHNDLKVAECLLPDRIQGLLQKAQSVESRYYDAGKGVHLLAISSILRSTASGSMLLMHR